MAVFNQVNLVVTDMEASTAFYRLLGVDVPAASEWPDATGWLHTETGGEGDTRFEWDNEPFARVWARDWPRPAGVVLGFGLPSAEAVDETYQRLTDAGHVGLQPPYDAFWGAHYAIVRDPDGNAVGLMGPSDPAKRYIPEAPG